MLHPQFKNSNTKEKTTIAAKSKENDKNCLPNIELIVFIVGYAHDISLKLQSLMA